MDRFKFSLRDMPRQELLSEYAERIPWRYNRRLSYLLKPILRINDKVNNNFIICFSARHLYIAGQNLLAIFFDGTLKVDDDCKQIREFVKRNSTEKGDEFTVEVRIGLETIQIYLYWTTNLILPQKLQIKTMEMLMYWLWMRNEKFYIQ